MIDQGVLNFCRCTYITHMIPCIKGCVASGVKLRFSYNQNIMLSGEDVLFCCFDN